jgi:alpha-L-fucosidase
MRLRTETILLLLALTLPLAACGGGGGAEADRLSWWREARFGLFIHWGLYAIPAGQWGNRTDHGEWIMNTAQIPVEQYEQFLARFNPVKFDADAWAKAARDAGMRYIVITSKHHDGFALFDSEVSDYDVMATPFQRDIMAELAEAARRHGLKICWYHSIMDWHHPDYLPRRPWEKRSAEGADFDRFVDYLHAQVTELLTKYGPIGVMWFDGEWEATWNHTYGQALYDLSLGLQPEVIVNNRVDAGRGGMAGMTEGAGFAGDFGTPEQEIPATGLPGLDWETCMTMNRHWGYNRFDKDYKSAPELIRMLVDIASKGGNFLLNIGPTAEGEFPPESLERLTAIGDWMDTNGESIYGTTASPFPALDWGRCTVRREGRRTRLYLHVFDRPADGRLMVPGIGNDPVRARLLAGGRRLAVAREGSDLVVSLPGELPDPVCTVVMLEVKGEPIVYLPPRIEAEADLFLRPLSVRISGGSSELTVRYTLDDSNPDGSAQVFERPFELSETTTVKARTFHHGEPVTPVIERTFRKAVPAPAQTVSGLQPGLRRLTYRGEWEVLPDFGRMAAARREPVMAVRLPQNIGEHIGLRFEGFVDVPASDVYRFLLTSDDGSRLLIDSGVVVDNDGLHGSVSRDGFIALAAGRHRLTVDWFNRTGGAELDLRWAPLGGPPAPLQPTALMRRP